MARRSSLKSLPNDVLDELKWHIEDDKMSAEELEAWLQEKGFTRSRTAIALFAKREREQQEKRKQWREWSRAAVEENGEKIDTTAQGRLTSEVLMSLLYDSAAKASYEGEEPDPKVLAMYAKIIKDLAGANRLHQDFEIKRTEIEEKERVKAADAAETAAVEGGATEEQAAFIRAQVMGISDRVKTEDDDG